MQRVAGVPVPQQLRHSVFLPSHSPRHFALIAWSHIPNRVVVSLPCNALFIYTYKFNPRQKLKGPRLIERSWEQEQWKINQGIVEFSADDIKEKDYVEDGEEVKGLVEGGWLNPNRKFLIPLCGGGVARGGGGGGGGGGAGGSLWDQYLQWDDCTRKGEGVGVWRGRCWLDVRVGFTDWPETVLPVGVSLRSSASFKRLPLRSSFISSSPSILKLLELASRSPSIIGRSPSPSDFLANGLAGASTLNDAAPWKKGEKGEGDSGSEASSPLKRPRRRDGAPRR